MSSSLPVPSQGSREAVLTASARIRGAFPELEALRETLSRPTYLASFLVLAAVVALAYLLLLPTLALDVTFNYLGFWVLAYLTPVEVFISAGMGTLIGLAIVLNLHLWRRRDCRPSGSTAASVVGGVALNAMGSMVCCGIVVPLLLSFFASGAALVASTNWVRSALSTYSPVLYALSFAALWLSVRFTSRRFAEANARGSEDETPELENAPATDLVVEGE